MVRNHCEIQFRFFFFSIGWIFLISKEYLIERVGVLTCRKVGKKNITRTYRTHYFFISADAELMFQLVGLRSLRNGYRIIDSFTEANDFAHRFSRCSGFSQKMMPRSFVRWDKYSEKARRIIPEASRRNISDKNGTRKRSTPPIYRQFSPLQHSLTFSNV